MSIIWAGGEDLDFPNGATPSLTTDGTYRTYRTGYARGSLVIDNVWIKSVTFPTVTSCWLSAQMLLPTQGGNLSAVGLFKSGTDTGLWFGVKGNKLSIIKRVSGVETLLSQEITSSINTGTLSRLDVQLGNYGTSATTTLFYNGTLVASFSGSVSDGVTTNLDQVWAYHAYEGYNARISEIIVSSDDSRQYPGLVTLAPNNTGLTDTWTGAYSTINGLNLSDASPNYVNAINQDQQFNLIDPPTGAYAVAAVIQSVRAAASVGSTPTKISLGYNSGGNVAVGAPITLSNGYQTYQQIDLINPVTGVAFTQSELAALQLDVRSIA